MNKDHRDPQELDLTKPRLALYKQKKKVHQDTLYWVDIQLAQRKGLKLHQTRSNAIILYDTLTAYCISKVVVMNTGETTWEKVYMSLQPPPKIIGCKNWMQKSLLAAKTPNESTLNKKPNYQERWDPWVGNRLWMDQNPSRVVCQCLFVHKDDGADENVNADQQRTGRPVGRQSFTQLEEIDIDFRVPGMSHAVVEKSEHLRGQEFVKRIENHPHRFMPACSRTTSTTHWAIIRRRRSTNWVMWSYSSCAKQHRKCNVLNIFSIGIKELCTAIGGQCLIDSESESFTNWDWMFSLSRTTWSRKGVATVLDTAKLKNRQSTT